MDEESLEGPPPSWWVIGDEPTGVYDVMILLFMWYEDQWDEFARIGLEITLVVEDGETLIHPRAPGTAA